MMNQDFLHKHVHEISNLTRFHIGRAVIINPDCDNSYNSDNLLWHIGHVVGFCRSGKTASTAVWVEVQTAMGKRRVDPNHLQ